MKESDIIKEVTGEKKKCLNDDKNLTKYITKIMIRKSKSKKSELKIPELLEEKDEIEKLYIYSKLAMELKDPSSLLLELSKTISFKLLQASINQNTQAEKICAIIAK